MLVNAEAAMVTSGTATLETALLKVPQIVCYKSSYLSFLIAKFIVKLNYISLVNIIMKKDVVDELIQSNCNSKNIFTGKVIEELSNQNIKLNITANKTKNFDSFKNIILNLKIQEGLIDLDQTKFNWKNHANFSLTDSLIYLKNGKLVLDDNSEIKLINKDEIYKFLITPKNLRKKINKININFTYLFDEKTININNIKVDDKLIANLSRLAKLKFDEDSSERMKSDLKTILGFVDSLSKIDTEGIEPLVYMSEEVNVLRADEISNEVSQENALKNAPQKDSDYFKVPTVLKK